MENNSINNQQETHLFLIWDKGIFQTDNILGDIKRKFKISKRTNIEWNYDDFNDKIAQFYGVNLIGLRRKVYHCGKGPFKVVIVEDNSPKYDYRFTSKGLKRVNTNIFDSKILYRNWTGGGHRVHGTNDTVESNRDINYIYENIVDEK